MINIDNKILFSHNVTIIQQLKEGEEYLYAVLIDICGVDFPDTVCALQAMGRLKRATKTTMQIKCLRIFMFELNLSHCLTNDNRIEWRFK